MARDGHAGFRHAALGGLEWDEQQARSLARELERVAVDRHTPRQDRTGSRAERFETQAASAIPMDGEWPEWLAEAAREIRWLEGEIERLRRR